MTITRFRALGLSAILTLTACGALIGIDDRSIDLGDGVEAGTSTEGGGVVDSGSKTDSAPPSDATTTDTGPGVTRPVTCGTTLTCNSPNETCCITGSSSSSGTPSYTYACTAALGGCPPGSGKYRLDCIDTEDCPPGQFCCGGYNAGGLGTYCKASQCGGGFEYTTCDRTKTGQCTGGRSCRQQITFSSSSGGGGTFPLPPPLGVCQ